MNSFLARLLVAVVGIVLSIAILVHVESVTPTKYRIEGVALTILKNRNGHIYIPGGLDVGSKFHIPLLWGHDYINEDSVLGSVTNLVVEPGKVLFTAEIEVSGKIEQDLLSGKLDSVSVGVVPIRYDVMPGNVIIAYEFEIVEISIVTVPAEKRAVISKITRMSWF